MSGRGTFLKTCVLGECIKNLNHKRQMENLLNCHSIGLHSFPVSLQDGLYKRIFYATKWHNMYKPFEIAVHPHHVDIKITVLDGVLMNQIFEVSETGRVVKKFKWNSHILNGNGGFEYLGKEILIKKSYISYNKGESFSMKACELHTVKVEQNKECVWMVEESIPSCEYFPINYSIHDLENWDSSGLYIKTTEEVKQEYIGKYLAVIQYRRSEGSV